MAPASPFDYIGLFNSAFISRDPVLVIEHANLYPLEGPVPEDRDFCIALGKANLLISGVDITLVAYSFMTLKAFEASAVLEKEGISAEVIDLRTVDYTSIDYGAIGNSLRKTGRLLLLEEGLFCGGIGGHLAYEVQRRFFDYLDSEIGRVAGKPMIMPVSRLNEKRAIPQVEDIHAAYQKVCLSQGNTEIPVL
ncbi:unnamed protein product, partial [marine sediment metagenome]